MTYAQPSHNMVYYVLERFVLGGALLTDKGHMKVEYFKRKCLCYQLME